MDDQEWEAHRETMACIQERDRSAKSVAAQLREGMILPPALRERLRGAAWDQLRKALDWKGLQLEPRGTG
ncbi:MAG TPA: hypothetical protein VMS76_17040 [Planctomycetota bacterium]|nr:hypothetical protein [Planctomycetota bacterium]